MIDEKSWYVNNSKNLITILPKDLFHQSFLNATIFHYIIFINHSTFLKYNPPNFSNVQFPLPYDRDDYFLNGRSHEILSRKSKQNRNTWSNRFT